MAGGLRASGLPLVWCVPEVRVVWVLAVCCCAVCGQGWVEVSVLWVLVRVGSVVSVSVGLV